MDNKDKRDADKREAFWARGEDGYKLKILLAKLNIKAPDFFEIIVNKKIDEIREFLTPTEAK